MNERSSRKQINMKDYCKQSRYSAHRGQVR